MRPTGRPSVRPRRKTGARSTWSSRSEGPVMRKLAVVGAGVLLAALVAMEGGVLTERAAAIQKAEKPRVSAGNGTLIIGSSPKQYWIIDEATEKIVGTIPFQS